MPGGTRNGVGGELAPAREHAGQKRGIEPGGERRRQRDADMGQRNHEHEIEDEIGGDRDNPDLDRRCGVAAGEKGRGQNLDQDEGGKPAGKRRERLRGRQRLAGAKRAALEQGGDERIGKDNQGDGGGQRQEERELHRPVLVVKRRRLRAFDFANRP